MLSRQLIIGFLVLTICSSHASAEETILSFHSEIEVFANAEMQVTETIEVKSEKKKIKRGIYRDFPLNYKDRFGNQYRVGFTIVSVKRNNRAELFHTKQTGNGIRIYIGDEDKILPSQNHRFDITYRTHRQLGFFDNHDELYWNVTGNEWEFPIQQASAEVRLPLSVDSNTITLEAYTGSKGSQGKDYLARLNDDAIPLFETSRRLEANEGLTIVVSWPKGHVIKPDLAKKMGYLLQDNAGTLIGLAGLILVLLYYFFIWSKVGKNPEQGVVFPHYEPPAGYSPASMRFIENMGYDDTCFAAAIVNLAVKGFVSITDKNDTYVLEKQESHQGEMAAGENSLLQTLFKSKNKIELKQTNHETISDTLKAHERSLKNDYEKIYFKTNSGFFIIGLLISISILIVSMFIQIKSQAAGPEVIFLLVWLSIWSIGVFALLYNCWHAWKSTRQNGSVIHAIVSTLFLIPFLSAEIIVISILVEQISLSFAVLIIVTVFINWQFYELLKAPTLAGRELLDKVEGFKHYIEVAEKHDLEYRYSGGKTPELFERILPYAIALGIEQSWGKQFEEQLNMTSEQQSYSPSWYYGTHWNPHHISSFTSALGSSLSSATSSAATAPGSSSGSGGGGFSGGGGGGGGGGGW